MPLRTRLRRVEADPLERDAVPQLHDERARDGVAVHVAEAVRDDDDPGAAVQPEPAQRALADVRDAAGRGIPLLAGGADQPDRGVAVGGDDVPQRERAVADAGAAAEDPRAGPARDQRGCARRPSA